MNYDRNIWLMAIAVAIVALVMTSCVRIGYYNDRGEMDAELVIRPTEEAIQDSITSGEIHEGVSAEITIPLDMN
jgi:hypothetical protein